MFLVVDQAGQPLSNLPGRDGALVATEQQFVGFMTQGHPETLEFCERKENYLFKANVCHAWRAQAGEFLRARNTSKCQTR